MQLDRLQLIDFKNIAEATLEFTPGFNGMLGLNGMGKSNLLDAIYTLSLTKSYSGVADKMLIRSGHPFFMLKGEYTRRGMPETVTLGLVEGKRKSLKCTGKEYKRMSEHVGRLPLVMMSPRDNDLVRGSGSERRRWLDMSISQSDPLYLEALMRYNGALEQRNRLLRDGVGDAAYFEVLDTTLDAAATTIVEGRRRFAARLGDIFTRYYRQLGAPGEAPAIAYETALEHGTMAELLRANRERDRVLRHTSGGPHRDDLLMTLDGLNVRQLASEGQCKTFTIALRLAQYEFLRGATGLKPMLLLDDIFDKLDAERVARIVELVSDNTFGQIFVTDTNRKHLDEILDHAQGDTRLWSVEEGRFTPLATAP